MLRRLLLPFLLLVLTWGGAHAVDIPSPPYWHTAMVHKSWVRRDGAPIGVFNLTQDARGMLWFASTEGLVRFDGVHFERILAIDGNKLRSANTNAILAVGTALWVGYSLGGVSVFDQGAVRHYGVPEGLPVGTTYKLARTRDGVVWLSSGAGLFRFDGARWHNVAPADGLPAGTIHYFSDLPDGSILANHATGLFRSTPGTFKFQQVTGIPGLEIHQVLANGTALLVDGKHRFFRYDALANVAKPIAFPPDAMPGTPFLDGRGALWVNADDGLKLLGKDGQTQRVFDGVNSLSGKQTYIHLDDREGNLWLTTENGVDMIRESRLATVPLPARMFRGLSVQAGGDGTVWIGNRKTDGNVATATFGLRPDGSHVDAPMHNLSASLRAPDGSVWCGNADGLWHHAGGRWQPWPLPPALRGSDVQSMAIDSAGRIWVAVFHNGVWRFDNGQWEAGGGNAALAARTQAKRTPISVHADPQGRIWFGYPGNRISVLEHDVLRDYGPDDGLDIGNVSVIISHQGQVLAGGDQGVALLGGARFASLQDTGGAALRGAAAMLVTSRGELWLHGADGLTRVTAADLQADLPAGRLRIDHFDDLDGYAGKPSQVRPLAVLTEMPDGRVWYASSLQVGYIEPGNIARNTLAPVPQVTALRTDQRSYAPTSGLVLPEYTRNVDVDFTSATLGLPERARFRYRLAGLEQDWRDAGTRRTASYSNLGPGAYRFEVLAANEDAVWSAAPATVSLHIAPAWFQTMWCRVLCVLATMALVSLLYWRRVRLVTTRVTERLRERLRERERIARALHDNFLQSVQALMMQFDLIRHRLPPDDPVHAEIDAALQTAGEVLHEGREQVLALRLNHELTGDLEAALSGLGHLLAPRHGTCFVFAVEGMPRPLRAACAAEAYAIGREALLNALRHAHSAHVHMTLRYSATRFELQVRDQGRGIDAVFQSAGNRPGHFGLPGMRERAADVGGTLEIDSGKDTGTTVTLRIPARVAYARKAAAAV